MMTSKELVKKTLHFQSPERIPRQLWALPWADIYHKEALQKINKDFPADIITSPGYQSSLPHTEGDPYALGFSKDEWGCVFENRQAGIIGEVKEPVLKDLKDVKDLRTPDELFSIDIQKINAFCKGNDHFVMGGCCPRPFERMQFLRKTENLYLDLAMQTDELFILIEKVHSFYKQELELWALTDVDALMFMDDWGSQRALLISPSLWRQLFKPLYMEYIDIAHQHGKSIFMHSDGNILQIIPDLIEIGVDAVNSQLFCMGIDRLAPYKGKITFWGEIDRQHLLPHGTREEIQKAVHLVKNTLYDKGGIIAQCEFGPGGNPDNVRTVFETWNILRL